MGGRSWRAPSGSRRTWRAGSSTGRSTSSSRGPRSEKKSHLPTYLIIHVPHTRGGEGCRESPPVRQGASAFPPLSGLLSPPLLLPSMLYPSRSLGGRMGRVVSPRARTSCAEHTMSLDHDHDHDHEHDHDHQAEVGRLEDWKAGRLEGWKTGRLEDWKASSPWHHPCQSP